LFFILLCSFIFILEATIIPLKTLEEYVPTPGGYLHSSCVHNVGNNAIVTPLENGEFHVQREDETETMIPKCGYPKLSDDVDGDGWQVFTQWDAGDDLTSFNGTWTVPDAPSSYASQLLYTFTGLVNTYSMNSDEQEVIIQPVLQYGVSPAGGGQNWGIASWYVGTSGLHSQLVQVNVGDTILGLMSKPNSASQDWSIVSTDKTTTKSTSLQVKAPVAAKEPWAFVTLEVYSVTDCTQYPTNPVVYVDLAVDVKDQSATPDWTATSFQVICNENVVVNSPSSFTINFH